MTGQGYNAQQRRAVNVIWTTAEQYGFAPRFVAFDADGVPDFYMNCIIGLVYKWYGEAMVQRLFDAWTGDARQSTLDGIAWLALESAAYAKEAPARPTLPALRRQAAQAFFDREYQRSRQQWMQQDQLLYTMQSARWRWVLGKESRMLTPKERQLSDALCCGGEWDATGLEGEIRRIMAQYLAFDGHIRRKDPFHIHFSGPLAALLTKLVPMQMIRTDELSVRHSAHTGQAPLTALSRALRATAEEENEKDRQYIETYFGRSLLDDLSLSRMEQSLCTGAHFGCHLWLTAGAAAEHPDNREAAHLARQAAGQFEKNRADYLANGDLYRRAQTRLTEQIRNCLLLHRQVEETPSRRGYLDGSRVWRQPTMGDDRVFLRSSDQPQPEFAVELLLDGSASRLGFQEVIAAQGYILAQSLCACGIPVRVSSFCSLRGYTVLRLLKDYGEKPDRQNLFRYFAAGWNRDGLALRAVGQLMEQSPAQKHLLILLTDASPNDGRRIQSDGSNPFSRDYGGAAGVTDAAAEVHALRQKGIRVAAVFMGENSAVPAAEKIFGRDFVRIRRMDQLAAAAGKLIETQIRELSL